MYHVVWRSRYLTGNISIWHVCHELNFSSAPGFVVFSCVFSCSSRLFVLHKPTSSSLLRICLTLPELILVSNKLKRNPQSPRLYLHSSLSSLGIGLYLFLKKMYIKGLNSYLVSAISLIIDLYVDHFRLIHAWMASPCIGSILYRIL